MSFPEILKAVEDTHSAFDVFQKKQDRALDELKADHGALRDRLEELEAKQKTPARSASTVAPPISDDCWESADGKLLPIMRKGCEFAKHYPANAEGLTLAAFVRGIARMKTTEAATKALSVGTNSAGGWAVPAILMPAILEALVPASSILLAGGGMVDLSRTEGKTFDFAAIDAIPTAAWRAEAGAVAESDPSFRVVATQPRSLAFYFKVSRELLADAPNIDAALRQVIVQAFAKELDRTGLRGSGSAPEPKGILGTTGVNTVTNGAAGASLATTAYANFFSAVQAILEDDAPMPTAAIMSPRSLVVLGGLLDSTDQPRTRPEMLRPMQFLASSQIPNNLTVGASTDCSEIYVGDFTRITFVMREAPSLQLLTELYAGTGQVAFLGHVRADVAVLYPKAFATVTGVRP